MGETFIINGGKIKMDITRKRFAELEDAEAMLNALINGGVDNWEFYDESLKGYTAEKDKQEAIEYLHENLIESICQGIEEPAGRGAGFGIGEETTNNSLQILKEGIRKICNETKC